MRTARCSGRHLISVLGGVSVWISLSVQRGSLSRGRSPYPTWGPPLDISTRGGCVCLEGSLCPEGVFVQKEVSLPHLGTDRHM